MIQIDVPIMMNSDDLSVFIEAEDLRTGESLWKGRGNSLVKGMVETLWRYMEADHRFSSTISGQAVIPAPLQLSDPEYEIDSILVRGPRDTARLANYGSTLSNFWLSNISNRNDDNYGGMRPSQLSESVDPDGEVLLTVQDSTGSSLFGRILVYGCTIAPWLNGVWATKKVTATTFILLGSEWPGGGTISLAADILTCKALAMSAGFPSTQTTNALMAYRTEADTVGNLIHQPAGFILGRDSRPVSIHDNALYDMIPVGVGPGQLSTSVGIFAAPSQVGSVVEFSQTRSIINEHADPTTIRELGFNACLEVSPATNSIAVNMLLAREIVNIELVHTASIGITYRIRTNTPVEGGFTRQFLELLYREYSRENREAKNIINGNNTDGINKNQFLLNLANAIPMSTTPFRPTLMHGLVVGSGTKNVEPSDYKLRDGFDDDTIITHGEGAGQLYYARGTNVNFPAIVGNKCSFFIERLFVNKSGSSVNVTEVAIYVHNVATSSSAPFCIAIYKLPDTVAVPAGEALNVRSEIGAVVGA